MTDIFALSPATARHALPCLVPGQAQKEFIVNEGLARIDALLHPIVFGTALTPPPESPTGAAWIVGAGASAEWEGRDDAIAWRDASGWNFIAPFDGLQVFDGAAGRYRTFAGGWDAAPAPGEPQGGATVDAEARAAIADILATLRAHRFISPAG